MARGHRTLNWIAAAGYLALVILASWYSRGRDEQRLRVELTMQKMVSANQIEGTVAVGVESLKGLAAHLALRPNLSRADFRRVAEQHWHNKAGLAAIEWQPLVPDAERRGLEGRIRRQGGDLAAFRLWEPGPDGLPLPARPRPLHLPVLYSDSPISQLDSSGLDLAYSSERMAAKWQAADRGEPRASAPSPLFFGQAGARGPLGLVISLPVYQNGVLPQESGLRRSRLLGFVALVFDVRAILAPLISQLGREGVALTLNAQGRELVSTDEDGKALRSLQSRSNLDIYGQQFELVLAAKPQFVEQNRYSYSRLLIASVTLFGGLLLAMLWRQQSNNRRLKATQSQLISSVQQLQHTQQELERNRKELRIKLRTSITASAVAHEVNQPLSTMRLLGQQMIQQLQHAPRANAPLLTMLHQLMGESDQVVNTTEKMRMLLRNAHTDRQRLDLCAIVRGTLLYLRRMLQEQQVEVESLGLEQAVWIEGDGQQLRLALGNVLRNAVEALGQQPVGGRRICLQLRSQGAEVQLQVADSGPGFPEEFLRQDNGEDGLLQSRKPRGSGIGLYVVRTTMENHGGRLELGRSPALGGAQVLLILPAPCVPKPLAEERGGEDASGRS